jgi:predicted SprT family Zn-dependent metalloprotease
MYHQRVEQGEQTENRLQRIARAFDMVNRTYFEGVIPTPTYRISTRMTNAAGMVYTDQWLMVISAPYFNHYGWESELRDTIAHECIHLFLAHVGRPSGHTKEFTAHCARIGATRHCKPMPRRRPHYRYLVQCPRCLTRGYRGSWSRGLACGACCEKYNEGRYSPRFALKLLRRTVTIPPLVTAA